MHFLENPWFLSITGIVIVACVGRLAELRERTLQLAAKRRKTETRESSAELGELRAEVMRLRDTSTQYDISIEQALTGIMRRLAALEQRAGLSSPEQASLPARDDKGKKASAASAFYSADPERIARVGRK